MSHVTCPKCGGQEHYAMYGLAAGGIGGYVICECGELLESSQDSEAEKIESRVDKPAPNTDFQS